jgi:glycosyltransferase involved in cell wall biosynthesis
MPFFSVIIPLHNKGKYIAGTLNSILAQDFTDYEIVIADDGSTDNSREVVMGFTDARIQYRYKENGGVSSARNHAMQEASGEYLAFIDADDYWYPGHLQELYNAIQAMPHLRVFTTLAEVENAAGIFLPHYTNLGTEALQEADFFKTSFARAILSSQSTAIHKSVPAAIGYFDAALVTCEDTDYWIRTGFKYRIGVVNKVTARHNYISGSLSHRRFSMAHATFYEKFADPEKENPAAKKMIDINRFSLALQCKIAGDRKSFEKLSGMISPSSLTLKQRMLMALPHGLLGSLKFLKEFLEKKKIRLKLF